MKESDLCKVREAFQSILRADYVAISDLSALGQLDEYYVDFLKNLPKILLNQDTYIQGRRGTGKTTLLMRAYYECLKTISPRVNEKSNILLGKKILPIYIDLSKCKELLEKEEANFEINFILRLVEEIRSQLRDIFDGSNLKLFVKDYSKLNKFNEIAEIIRNGIVLKSHISAKNIEKTTKMTDTVGAGVSLDKVGIDVEASNEEMCLLNYSIDDERGLDANTFVNILGEIRKQSKLDAIYIFVDEFSDLDESEQLRFSELLKKLLGSKNNIFFKIGTITDRYNFGEKIIIGRDIYPLSLDLSDFVEKYGGIVAAQRVLNQYTDELIRKRLKTYAPSIDIKSVFGESQNVMFDRISMEAMGVSRTIGLVLQNALAQAEIRNEPIKLNDVNVGIRETRKIYFKQFQGAIKKKALPGFYMDMWNDLLKRALTEKNKNGDRPASHFMVDPIRKKYLNIFCENFMVHCLEDSRASKYGGNYVLFALDYDICNDNNIKYATEKDQFTAVRFIYDSLFKDYDCYFSKEAIKSYRCPKCCRIYEEEEVAKAKVKRCFECDEKLEEIIHQAVQLTEGNYTEVEIKILGIISTLSEEEAMSATEIGDAVGCSRQKVALWCSRVLSKKGLISIKDCEGHNLYYDGAQ
ncbi:MAG: hypothetical protein E7301_07850 [Butyrivibrio sp.]|nr:hypothetical protein [Butyrivibrio sp.]